MKLETFFEKFELFAEVPDAVGRMRELVLRLAVQGKLVPQDPNDEPASILLERVRSARRRLADKGSLKTKVHIPEIEADDQLYAVPKTWLWVPLNELTELVYGKLLPTSDLLPTGFPVFGANGIIGCFSKYIYEDKMLLISCRGAYSGTPNISPPKCYVTNNSIVCEFFEPKDCDIRFYHAVISVSPRGGIVTGSAQPQVTVANAIKLPVPIPPIAEQKRIVAKVDELMALCDRLEAQQQERETRHAVLARASLARFAAAPTPANLPFLFHPSYTIPPADLRKSILTLAVQGKLVPQDPNDEPAERTFVGLKPLSEGSIAGTDMPNQWALCRYRSLTTLVTSGSRGWKEFYAVKGSIFVRTQNIKTDKLVLDDIAFVDLPKSAEGMRAQVLKDDILITITGANVTKAAMVGEQIPEAYVSQHIALTRPRWSKISEWLHLCFISHGSARGTLEQLAYGDKPGLNLDNIRDLMLPIPPLAEQRRIVAKVDHLMAMVDELEAQLVTSRTAAANLLDALVAELTGTTVKRRPATAPRAAASMQPDAAVIDDQGDAETTPGSAGHQPGSDATSRAGARRSRELGDATTSLVALMRERGSLSNAEAQAATGLDAATLRLHLQRLVAEGAATIAGQKRGTRYVATRLGVNP